MAKIQTIFHAIAPANSSNIEPVHSRTLKYFLERDPAFRGDFLERFVADSFRNRNGLGRGEDPLVKVHSEDLLSGNKRIDITIEFPMKALIGIEVKTSDASTTSGQLNDYWERLHAKKEYIHLDQFMVYITPFSATNLPSPEARERVHAIKEFEQFQSAHPECGSHANWTEVSGLYPAERDSFLGCIYEHHKQFIEVSVCNPGRITLNQNARELASFLGVEVVNRFFELMEQEDVHFSTTDSKFNFDLQENEHRYEAMVEGIRGLLESELLNKGARRNDQKNGPILRIEYQQGRFGPFFKKLFLLFKAHPYAWLKGNKDLGLRAAHPDHKTTGVSLITLSRDSFSIKRNR